SSASTAPVSSRSSSFRSEAHEQRVQRKLHVDSRSQPIQEPLRGLEPLEEDPRGEGTPCIMQRIGVARCDGLRIRRRQAPADRALELADQPLQLKLRVLARPLLGQHARVTPVFTHFLKFYV